jgi:hypothetical protein
MADNIPQQKRTVLKTHLTHHAAHRQQREGREHAH